MVAELTRLAVVLGVMAAAPAALGAQEPAQLPAPGDTIRTAPGPHYAAGALHRAFFGTEYRALWTTPVTVPALDLAHVAGGLTPTTAGGRFQTKSLRFRGADGYAYGFRSVDKDPAILPPELSGTFIEDLVRDQTSAQHPYAPGVTGPLMEAVGIPHTDPQLVVLPDDPGLGEFREEFRGIIGYFERRATIEPGRPGFAGALEIIESDELLARTERGPADRVDARAFLNARLFDLVIGDWDRHRGQWTWARRTPEAPYQWIPIPEDRDQAFARFDGFLLGVARLATPFIMNYGERYGSVFGATWNGRDLDRRYLTELDRPVWDSVAASLAARLTDSVITAAVQTLPPQAYALDGARLARTLTARRDALGPYARQVYDLLMAEATLHATDAAEQVTIDRHADGRVEVTVAERGRTASPYLHRVFDPAATHDLRLFLHGGADQVVIRGRSRAITLRVVGGGHATVVDSSGDGHVRFYATGDDRAVGPAPTHVDTRADAGPPPPRPYDDYRDWGSFWMPSWWGSFGPDLGAFVGGGFARTDYGFRKYPYASRLQVRAGWSFGAATGRADFDAVVHRENSRARTTLYVRASGIEIVKYHGLGNEIVLSGADDFYRVRQQQYLFMPGLVYPLGRHGEIGLGASVEFVKTREGDGRIVDVTAPYGSGEWGQVGGRLRLAWDSRDQPGYATRGLYAAVTGGIAPPVWDVDSTYGYVEGAVSTYLTAPSAPFRPTLALRAGGKQVWGPYPFFAAAFIGDAGSVRLGRQNRFGGDAAVYGNAELRLRLTRFFFILPGDLGIFGLADAGRVFLDGESSDQWHSSFGGGLWVSVLRPGTILSVALTRGAGRTGVYIGSGMAF